MSTRERLRSAALAMFAAEGYEAVTVARVAAAAGVSHMTFFRHFATKEAVVVDDLFDPVIAGAVAAQPPGPPLRRAVRGLLAALDDPAARAELASEEFRRRVALASSTPSLRGAVWAASEATRDAVATALAGPSDGWDPPTDVAAGAAAAAVIGAATAILTAWAHDPGADPADALRDGLAGLIRDTP